MLIYIQRDGIEQGPYSLDVVRMHLRDGSFEVSDLARHEGAGEWTPLALLPDVIGRAGHDADDLPAHPPFSIFGICSMILGFFSLAIAPAVPLAIMAGHMAHLRIRRSSGRLGGAGFAIAGFSLGYTGLLFFVIRTFR